MHENCRLSIHWHLLGSVALAVAFACNASAQATFTSVLIDFGLDSQETPGNWNNISGPPAAGGGARAWDAIAAFPTQTNLVDENGVTTSIGFDLFGCVDTASCGLDIGGFNSAFTNSTGYPDAATRDTMFLNNTDGIGGAPNRVATFQFSGLDAAPGTSTLYTLKMYGQIGTQTRADNTWSAGGKTVSSNPNRNYDESAGGVGTTVAVIPFLTASGSTSTNGTIDLDWTTTPTGAFNQGQWNTLELEIVTNLLLGDVDDDGTVDTDDARIIFNNFNRPGATFFEGDQNLDGNVNFDDYLIWRGEFAGPLSELIAAGLPVPEPSSCMLVAVAAFAVATRRSRTARVG